MSVSWSAWLNQKSISDVVLDAFEGKLPTDLLSKLKLKIETKEDVKELKECLKSTKKILSKEDFKELKDEVNQIIEDNKFFGSKRGKYIAEINDWHQLFHKEFRSYENYENVMIGGHSSKYVVMVSGYVANENISEELLSYVISKDPPFKILWDVKIGRYT